jgi:hypothetical protein
MVARPWPKGSFDGPSIPSLAVEIAKSFRGDIDEYEKARRAPLDIDASIGHG